MTDKQDFKPVKVKIKSSKQKSAKHIAGDLLYSGVNLFGKLSEIYLEKIKNGEMFTTFSQDFTPKESSSTQDYSTPSMVKKSSTASAVSTTSQYTQGLLQSSKVFQMDQEIMSLFRKVQKKDAITKVKALRALHMHIQKVGEQQTEGFEYVDLDTELSQVLTFFLYHFERIVTYENEKSVREAAHDVLGEFLITCRKNFAHHIINLFPLWYISFYDNAPEIRTKARNNFMKTFHTPEKRSAMFRKSVENPGVLNTSDGISISLNYLYFIHEKITHFEMLLSEDMTLLDKAQRDALYDRIISGCLESLSDSFETFASRKEGQKEKSWTDEHTKEYISQIVDVFGLDSTEATPTIYKFLAAKFSPPIRAAALKLLEKMSNYIITADDSNKEMFNKHLHKLGNSLFSAITDESSQVQKVLWKSVLFNFCMQFKDNIWEQVDLKKALLPQLHICLKNAGFGAHTDLYKNFVALVSILPVFQFEEPFETQCKIDQPASKQKPQDKPEEETKGEEDKEQSEKDKKGKKKQKKGKEKAAEGGADKFVKNSFSISEKINIMFEIMKSLFAGLSVEEAVAFNEEVINSYYETVSYLYIKRIIPAIEHFESKGDTKNLENLRKKAVQCFMLPITEYLKKNDPKMSRSLYNIIPVKFSQTLTLLANKGIDIKRLEDVFTDIQETMTIGLERSPHNAIKVLSALLISIPHENVYFERMQHVGSHIIQSLYAGLLDGVKNMSKDTMEKFEKDVEIFSYIAHNLLTMNLTSPIFELGENERVNGKIEPYEFTILTSILGIVKMLSKKLKPEFLQALELIEEKIWLCLVLRVNYLCKRESKEVINFMEGTMLDFIFENIKSYEISDDRYLKFVVEYISPADCIGVLVSENIEKQRLDPRKFKNKVLNERNKALDELFVPYEHFMRESQKVQDKCLKVLFIDMIDEYSKSHQILTLYSIFQRKIEDYVLYKQNKIDHTILTEDTIKSILETTLEFLQETDQVHKSFQLSELGNVLSKLIMNTKHNDAIFDL